MCQTHQDTQDPSNASSVQPEDPISVGEAIDQRITDSLIERVEKDNHSIEAVVRNLIAGPDAETNLDIGEVFRDQERVAVLNCNFLKPRNEALKYLVLNLWLRLIFRKRDKNSRLPRAPLEIRELKDIAPSVIGNAKYKTEVKALQTTIYEIATRGGSRRMMMIGSTQKLNDVYKPVRTNMPIKILLQLGEDEIMTLDRPCNFSPRQKGQLASFRVGWGMLINDGKSTGRLTGGPHAAGSASATNTGEIATRRRGAHGCSRAAAPGGSLGTETKTYTSTRGRAT
ncbi:hypothetical protein [Halorubrum laminariae]|uniref:Uncharacterized protein n=1 Tax=Halorubrum laminariae TaxID=1433523 RepID=A0ABD6C5R4_9EURY|nr:hypothetical protein [Halorubrum laminariae]